MRRSTLLPLFWALACLATLQGLPQAQSTAPGQIPGGRRGDLADDPSFQRRLTPEVFVVERAAPAVVFIEASRPLVRKTPLGGTRRFERDSKGTGVLIKPEGFIVTNWHVVANAERILVHHDPDRSGLPRQYEAQLVSYVDSEDLALLKISGDSEFPVVDMGTSGDLLLGERAIAIGNPFNQQLSVSSGIISGLHRDLEAPWEGQLFSFRDLIQTDASINPGNSGGPLLNVNGELIGINTLVNLEAENMGYAIPVDRLKVVLADSLFEPDLARAWYGFDLADDERLLIDRVWPGGPAALSKLLVGERVVAIDGVPLSGLDAYRLKRIALLPREPMTLSVDGPRGPRVLALSGWTKVEGLLFERAGLTVEPWSARLPNTYYEVRSVVVRRLEKDGPATALGLRDGDILSAVRVFGDQRSWTLQSAEAFAELIEDLPADTRLEVEIWRDEDRDGLPQEAEFLRGELLLRPGR